MSVTYTEERYWVAMLEAESRGLLDEHNAELNGRKDRRPRKLDHPAYLAAETQGLLHLMVVRDAGVMIGYFVSFIGPHKHYADTLCAFEDGYFLTKSHRQGLAGYRMVREWVKMMRARGDIDELYLMTKVGERDVDHSPMFERIGFAKTDYLMRMWIKD